MAAVADVTTAAVADSATKPAIVVDDVVAILGAVMTYMTAANSGTEHDNTPPAATSATPVSNKIVVEVPKVPPAVTVVEPLGESYRP
jgi:hypothetical protein